MAISPSSTVSVSIDTAPVSTASNVEKPACFKPFFSVFLHKLIFANLEHIPIKDKLLGRILPLQHPQGVEHRFKVVIILRITICDTCTPEVFSHVHPSLIILIGRRLELANNFRLIEGFAFLLLILRELDGRLLHNLIDQAGARLMLLVHHLYNII